MQKLDWMNTLKAGDTVVYRHLGRCGQNGSIAVETPVTVTAVGRKSVFVGEKRFSKWNGREVKSDGTPVYMFYHGLECMRIRPVNENDMDIFHAERERIIEEILSTDFRSYDLPKLRMLCEQIRRSAR